MGDQIDLKEVAREGGLSEGRSASKDPSLREYTPQQNTEVTSSPAAAAADYHPDINPYRPGQNDPPSSSFAPVGQRGHPLSKEGPGDGFRRDMTYSTMPGQYPPPPPPPSVQGRPRTHTPLNHDNSHQRNTPLHLRGSARSHSGFRLTGQQISMKFGTLSEPPGAQNQHPGHQFADVDSSSMGRSSIESYGRQSPESSGAPETAGRLPPPPQHHVGSIRSHVNVQHPYSRDYHNAPPAEHYPPLSHHHHHQQQHQYHPSHQGFVPQHQRHSQPGLAYSASDYPQGTRPRSYSNSYPDPPQQFRGPPPGVISSRSSRSPSPHLFEYGQGRYPMGRPQLHPHSVHPPARYHPRDQQYVYGAPPCVIPPNHPNSSNHTAQAHSSVSSQNDTSRSESIIEDQGRQNNDPTAATASILLSLGNKDSSKEDQEKPSSTKDDNRPATSMNNKDDSQDEMDEHLDLPACVSGDTHDDESSLRRATSSPRQEDEQAMSSLTQSVSCDTAEASQHSEDLNQQKSTDSTETTATAQEEASFFVPEHYPTRLALPRDGAKLNALHCFLRSEMLEIFVVQPRKGTKKPQSYAPGSSVGRVGLRCVHCAIHRQRHGGDTSDEAPMAVFYPKSVAEIYRLVTSWQRCHVRKCKTLPPAVRKRWQELRDTEKTRGKTHYWVLSAEEIGLVDCQTKAGGVRFGPKVLDYRPSLACTDMQEHGQNNGDKASLHPQTEPAV